jgi:hypothetical protein
VPETWQFSFINVDDRCIVCKKKRIERNVCVVFASQSI